MPADSFCIKFLLLATFNDSFEVVRKYFPENKTQMFRKAPELSVEFFQLGNGCRDIFCVVTYVDQCDAAHLADFLDGFSE